MIIAYETIKDIAGLQKFLHGMLHGREYDSHARHEHAPDVDRTWAYFALWLIANIDWNVGVNIRTRKGQMTNSGTFWLGNRQIYFTYDHRVSHHVGAAVVFYEGNRSGKKILMINDAMLSRHLKRELNSLWPQQAAA